MPADVLFGGPKELTGRGLAYYSSQRSGDDNRLIPIDLNAQLDASFE